MEYFDDFEKCQKEEMSEEGSAVDQMWKYQIQKKLVAAQRHSSYYSINGGKVDLIIIYV